MSKALKEAINKALEKKHRGICIISAEILQAVLNYIDNSIPKEVVEKKIEYYKNLIEECKNDEEHYGEIYLYKIYIDALQKLLEEK